MTEPAAPFRTVVVGLGNPLLTDDGVGIRVARALRGALGDRADVEVVELCTGGIAVMEAFVGSTRGILVDAMTAGGRPGTVYRRTSADLGASRNAACAHDTDLGTALAVGRRLGLSLPREVEVWGVEPARVDVFGEELTPAVARAVPDLVEAIRASLDAPPPGGRTA